MLHLIKEDKQTEQLPVRIDLEPERKMYKEKQ